MLSRILIVMNVWMCRKYHLCMNSATFSCLRARVSCKEKRECQLSISKTQFIVVFMFSFCHLPCNSMDDLFSFFLLIYSFSDAMILCHRNMNLNTQAGTRSTIWWRVYFSRFSFREYAVFSLLRSYNTHWLTILTIYVHITHTHSAADTFSQLFSRAHITHSAFFALLLIWW